MDDKTGITDLIATARGALDETVEISDVQEAIYREDLFELQYDPKLPELGGSSQPGASYEALKVIKMRLEDIARKHRVTQGDLYELFVDRHMGRIGTDQDENTVAGRLISGLFTYAVHGLNADVSERIGKAIAIKVVELAKSPELEIRDYAAKFVDMLDYHFSEDDTRPEMPTF